MDKNYELFAINRDTRDKKITSVNLKRIYDNNANYRKARIGQLSNPKKDIVFNDPAFRIEVNSEIMREIGNNTVKLRRIYELYDV